jgi:choline-sulfatase
MVRKDRWKYHEYIGFEPELFDLESDPDETTNLAGNPAYAAHVATLRDELRKIVDPELADHQAKADQQALVERFGGRVTAFRMGTEGATPAPIG